MRTGSRRHRATREPDERVEPLSRGARVESLARERVPLGQVRRVAARGDGPRRVEEDRRARRSVRAVEHLADLDGVLLGRAAAELLRVAAFDAEIARVDLALPDGAVDNLANEVRARG